MDRTETKREDSLKTIYYPVLTYSISTKNKLGFLLKINWGFETSTISTIYISGEWYG